MLSRNKRFQRAGLSVIILITAAVGIYMLKSSHAASPYASVNADTGTTGGGALKQPCSGASDSNCVVFAGSAQGVPFIGLNDFVGWGPPLTHQYLSDGFRWARISVDGSYSPNNAIDTALSTGCGDGMTSDQSLACNVIVILPEATPIENTQGQITGWDASVPMSWMDHYNTAADASRIVYEFGNEAYLDNSGYGMTAPNYAQSYEATYNAKHATSIAQPLLFMTTGDPCWSGIEDACDPTGTELYLEKAMDASKGGVTNLKVDAFSTHTYGGANSNWNNSTNGVNALLAQHQDAVGHGFTNTPWYVTEWGVTLDPSQASSEPSSSDCLYTASYTAQATCITNAYNQMITYGDGVNGTWLKGIMYYQTHDDSTGWWGLLTSPNAPSHDSAGELAGSETACQTGQPPPPCGTANTPITLRPSYNALKAFLTNH